MSSPPELIETCKQSWMFNFLFLLTFVRVRILWKSSLLDEMMALSYSFLERERERQFPNSRSVETLLLYGTWLEVLWPKVKQGMKISREGLDCALNIICPSCCRLVSSPSLKESFWLWKLSRNSLFLSLRFFSLTAFSQETVGKYPFLFLIPFSLESTNVSWMC